MQHCACPPRRAVNLNGVPQAQDCEFQFSSATFDRATAEAFTGNKDSPKDTDLRSYGSNMFDRNR